MRVRRLCAALISTTLASGAFVAVAAPSHAEGNSCTSATPFAGNAASTVGPGDAVDYWSYSATFPGTYRFTLSSAQTTANLYVYDQTCASLRCTGPQAGTVEWCEVAVNTPATFTVRVFDGAATTPNAYTLAAEWRTQPNLGTQCADGVDNDGDGFADTADTGCSGLFDTSESDAAPCPSVAGVVTCVSLTAGDEITRVNVYGPDVDDPVAVTGSIDLYQFTLPGNTVVNLPCVVVNGVDPCAALGGTFFARIAGIGPVNAPGVDPLIDEPITSIGLCEATLTATVNSIGVQSLGAVAVC